MVLTLSIALIIIAFSLYDYFSSRSWQMVTSKERNETVFENRNKEYGAYKIRKDYDKRLLLIILGLTMGIGGLWAASNLFKPIEKKKEVSVVMENWTDAMLDTEKDEPEIPEPEVKQAAAPSMQDIIKFREPVVTDQKDLEPQMSIPEPGKAVGLEEQKGDPNADPFDPTKITSIKGTGGDGIDKKKIDEKPREVVDEPALFPGGMSALHKYIMDNIDISSIEGSSKVYLKFVVDTDGRISSVIVTKTTEDCKSCEKAAIKVVKSMPPWTPGKVNGEPVKSYYRLPINIQ